MIARKTIAAAVGAGVALAAITVAAPASAQSYGGCTSSNGAGTGAVIGGLGGAVAGNQLSARGRHTENTVIGGLLGAVAGAAIGSSSRTTNCGPSGYDNRGAYYDDRYDSRYDNRSYYDNRGGYYDNRGYDRAYQQGYDRGYYEAPPAYVAPAPVYVAPPPVVYVTPRYSYGRPYRYYGW